MPITGLGGAAAVDPVASLVTALTAAAGNYASPQGAWSSATTYTVNQVVTYGGGTYRAKTTSTNITPGTDATKWESWGGGVFTNQGNWATSTAYVVGDVVTQSGQRYACRTAHTSGTFATDLAAAKWVTLDAVTALAASNNLSDLVSASAARTSLGAGAASGLATLDSSTLVPAAQMGTGSASSATVLQGDRTWATAVTLAQSGQTPSQSPVASGTAASVGSLAYAARADHVHASFGLLSMFGIGANGAATFDGAGAVANASRSGSTYTATADMHFTSATFSNGVTLNMDGYRLFVRGALACPSGSATITVTPLAPSGTNNSAQAGATTTQTYGAGNGRGRPLGPAAKGATGVTGVGAGPGAFGSLQAVLSPVTGSSGNGGSGVSGAGGTGANHNQANWDSSSIRLAPFASLGLTWSFDTPNTWNAGQNGLGPIHGGRGGASGAGDGTNPGGCGGCGGNVLVVNAMSISGGVSFTAPGGAGGTPTTGNCGGGGGGTGGVTIVNTLDTTGWTGTNTAPAGVHGTGVGSGGNGTDGAAGFVQTITWL